MSFEEIPPSASEVAARIAASHVWLVAETQSRLVGYAYAAPFHPRSAYRWSAEVSVYLAESARGRGLGRSLVESVLEWLLRNGYVNAFAGITLPNPASVHLFESVGFEQVALQHSVGFKLGAWHDVGWWQRQLREPTVPPPRLMP